MRIGVLTENTSFLTQIGAEHGLSLYIQTRQATILFDMGQSDLFVRNAAAMGAELSQVDLAVVSHGHYDHGGGLAAFLQQNPHAPVYVHQQAFQPHYNGTEKYIGLSLELANHPRLVITRENQRLLEGVELFTGNQQLGGKPSLTPHLTLRQGDRFLPDDFCHEQYLLIEEAGRRVLFSGCSHKGILPLVDWVRPDLLIGGFHLSHLPLDEELQALGRRLSEYATQYYTCHCTGTAQAEFLMECMPNLQILSAGQWLVL